MCNCEVEFLTTLGLGNVSVLWTDLKMWGWRVGMFEYFIFIFMCWRQFFEKVDKTKHVTLKTVIHFHT